MDLKAEHLTLPAGMQWARWLLRYTEQAERKLARRDTAGHLQAHFASSGRRKLVFTLLMRLVDAASPTMEDLIAQKLARMSPLLALNAKLATSAQREEAAAELLDELEAAEDPFTDGGPLAHVPLLAEVLDHLTGQFVDMALELAGRLAQDRADIARKLFCGQDFGLIDDVTADGSDAHFHGRFTCMLHAAGKRFLYKPHDCRIDVLWQLWKRSTSRSSPTTAARHLCRSCLSASAVAFSPASAQTAAATRETTASSSARTLSRIQDGTAASPKPVALAFIPLNTAFIHLGRYLRCPSSYNEHVTKTRTRDPLRRSTWQR